jgi:hypothetical protein
MFKFLENIGDYFSGNYFTSDFNKKVIEKSGYNDEDLKTFESNIRRLKEKYFAFKKDYIDLSRCKDQIQRTNRFHSELLKALGYDGKSNNYNELFHLDDTQVVPVRQIYTRGDKPHLFIMEMKAIIKTTEIEPKGLFEQNWIRSQWDLVFQVEDGDTLTPSIINEAINELFLIDQHIRPTYILLLAGNEIYLLHFEKWFKGSYLRFKLEDLFDEATLHKDYYQLFYLLLCKNGLAPEADILLMDQLDEDSHKSAYAVTKDLKEGIIRAVELLANEAIHYKKKVLNQEFDESNDAFEQQMKDDCLTMIYRLLFVFYAESRPDLGILPMNDSVYEKGYSLDMLRELEQVQLNSATSQMGYFFHDSLQHLFDLLNQGYRYKEINNKSFTINRLDTPLFDDEKFHHLKDIKFRNGIWQEIICQLSLSQKQKGKPRGRISYANLGINQLGSVYEGLLAYRGFYAEQDYIEVHEADEPNEGTFVVPRIRIDDFESNEILKDEDGKVKVLTKGTFVYRLSGRDRQQSASYYTPEVLTRTTVKYTLKPILERLDKKQIKADDLLELKILEPAQGASAFQNEVVNQVAEAYLDTKQNELKKKVPAKDYQDQLQRVKAYIATNNVYGVDINPTAIELGKLSLWLNVIHKDMEVPYFGYRLGVGNAVVGVWLKVYEKKNVIVEFPFEGTKKARETPIKKEWWDRAPQMSGFKNGKNVRKEEEIYHFLLPDKNMVPSASIKLLKAEHPVEAKAVSEWRTEFCKPIRNDEFSVLQKINKRIDELLEEHYNFQNLINQYTGEKKNFFGHEQIQGVMFTAYDEKDQLAQQRQKHNAPYFKLKMIMDYWCALWFWDVRKAVELPTRKQWYEDIRNILELDLEEVMREDKAEADFFTPISEQTEIFNEPKQARLKAYRNNSEKEVTINSIKEYTNRQDLFINHRLEIIKDLAVRYRFFHNQLEFIEVFKLNSGFDIIVGNPPWLKILFEEKGIIAEKFPEIEIRSTTAPQIRKMQSEFIADEKQKELYFTEYVGTESSAVFMNAFQNYPLLKGQQTNMYKCVLENNFNLLSKNGFMGLLHPEGIYDDPNGEAFRKEIYKRLKYHFQFQNAFNLFSEVAHREKYGTNIYSGAVSEVNFFSINNLFHPSTIDGSFVHDGKGICGGIKIRDHDNYIWNVKPHMDRIVNFNKERLVLLAQTFENKKEGDGAKLVSIHSESILKALEKLNAFKSSVNDFKTKITVCWDETNDVNEGTIVRHTSFPDFNKYQMIYSGPHFFVSNPLYKTPKEICIEKADYDIIDFGSIKEDFFARSNYKPGESFVDKFPDIIKGFEIGKANDGHMEYDRWINYYKLGFRKMLGQPNERTLISSILPPNTSHTNGVISIIFKDNWKLIELAAISSSIILDFFIKTVGASNLTDSRLTAFPLGIDERFKVPLFVRTLLLNCINSQYRILWENHFSTKYALDHWSISDDRLKAFSSLTDIWDWQAPLRNYFERRQALVEIDVIVAMALGLSLEELILIYNVQFPVLQQNEDDTWYDQKGNVVFTCSKGLGGVGLDRMDWEKVKNNKKDDLVIHTISKSELYRGKQITYYPPFTKCDRVEDYKRAWVHFENRFK